MPNILVVDDSPVQRQFAGEIIISQAGCQVTYASDGREALRLMEQRLPDLVLTDLQMPDMDGLELVAAVKNDYPMVPVVLMTAVGSEEIASEALRRGAASYVPKRRLIEDLAPTLANVLAASSTERDHPRLLHYLDEQDSQFTLRNDMELVELMVRYLSQALCCLPLGDETERLRVGIAVEEALKNAYYHGNLEVGRDWDPAGGRSRDEMAGERQEQDPYQNRNIRVRVRINREEAAFTIRDEGRGFDSRRWTAAAVTTDDAQPGRGITLMRTIMDEVRYNAAGNEVTLIKRRAPDSQADPDEASV